MASDLVLRLLPLLRGVEQDQAGFLRRRRLRTERNENTRSLARLFSSSRPTPPNAAFEAVSAQRQAQRPGLHHVEPENPGVRDAVVIAHYSTSPINAKQLFEERFCSLRQRVIDTHRGSPGSFCKVTAAESS